MKLMKFFLGFVVICLFTLFATANLEKVQIDFLFDNQPLLGYSQVNVVPDENTTDITDREPRKVPLFLVIFVTFGFGFIVSWILSSSLVRTHKQTAKKLKKQCDLLVKERDELRNLPVSVPMDDIDDDGIQNKNRSNLPVT